MVREIFGIVLVFLGSLLLLMLLLQLINNAVVYTSLRFLAMFAMTNAYRVHPQHCIRNLHPPGRVPFIS